MAVFMTSSGFTGYLLLCLELSSIQLSMTAKTCEKIDDCSCRKSSGSVISLWEIDGGSGGPPSAFKDRPGASASFEFSWNPCTPFSEGDGCNNVLLCQTYVSSVQKPTFPIGRSARSFIVNDTSTVTMEYDPVEYKGTKRTGVVILKCDPSGKGPGTLTKFNQEGNTYTSTLTSRCACDDRCALPLRPASSDSSGRLSIGSILLIVFFPLLLVYLVGGILFNKYQRGIESIPEVFPNYSFWKDFPFLVKDGFVFTFTGIAGCCRSLHRKLSGDSYAKI